MTDNVVNSVVTDDGVCNIDSVNFDSDTDGNGNLVNAGNECINDETSNFCN